MNYDKEFKTYEDYIRYLCRGAITQIEVHGKKMVTISVRDETEMEEVSLRLWTIYEDRDDVDIFFEIKNIH
tara:strand:- start:3411 stop:3623 length:213 start_codon:yes stop_codon:yes gene_type:complete